VATPMNGQEPTPEPLEPEEFPVETDLDEDALLQLEDAIDRLVLSATMWSEPIVDLALGEEGIPEEEQEAIDLDLYLEDNLVLELYNAMVYEDEDLPNLVGLRNIANAIVRNVESGIRLLDIAEEEESGAPIFVFESEDGTAGLLILADGWVIDSWETLPEED